MVSLRKLTSARVPFEGLRACSTSRGMVSLRKLTSARVPLEGLRACSTHPVVCFGRRLVSPEGCYLCATA
ncbi:unnamed protein product [Prunus armeniaca]